MPQPPLSLGSPILGPAENAGQQKNLVNEADTKPWKALKIADAQWANFEKYRATIKYLARKGVPKDYRYNVWFYGSGAYDLKVHAPPGYYASMAASTSNIADEVIYSIEEEVRNIQYSLPCFPFLKTVRSTEGLSRILLAFASRNPNCGFYKGIHMLAAIIWATLGRDHEEDAFWILIALIEKILLPTFNGELSPALKVEIAVLDAFVCQKLPQVASHYSKAIGSNTLSQITGPWLSTGFLCTLPINAVLRIWDCAFVEGSKVIHRLALALLKVHSTCVTSCLAIDTTARVLENRIRKSDLEHLMRTAFRDLGSFPKSQLILNRTAAVKSILGSSLSLVGANSNTPRLTTSGAIHLTASSGVASGKISPANSSSIAPSIAISDSRSTPSSSTSSTTSHAVSSSLKKSSSVRESDAAKAVSVSVLQSSSSVRDSRHGRSDSSGIIEINTSYNSGNINEVMHSTTAASSTFNTNSAVGHASSDTSSVSTAATSNAPVRTASHKTLRISEPSRNASRLIDDLEVGGRMGGSIPTAAIHEAKESSSISYIRPTQGGIGSSSNSGTTVIAGGVHGSKNVSNSNSSNVKGGGQDGVSKGVFSGGNIVNVIRTSLNGLGSSSSSSSSTVVPSNNSNIPLPSMKASSGISNVGNDRTTPTSVVDDASPSSKIIFGLVRSHSGQLNRLSRHSSNSGYSSDGATSDIMELGYRW
mmetsp:Transcript_24306/g.43538  ORF Transcript_24306/g.43538 Transcript_24306/m.43538 type:complete len:704 (-) Transcript_24306:541-2652(-)|eukprot:CAMPEP_0175053294 /NCGR_PEP_ID=MMETSP0052_2-20121109/8842_1 /TAXON_ID=51329 ORGANISM="Polytomella parva, Strain SAG 63-3" /NCGR_SAMPLE_ID=MMETSP0052_2 /ASSEMBLY_ACC=CAM_ASM_000194 /LENGTH=703 /DNA_ID=CAMNT_0016317807 /DNA_START=171 /DNA_END=2282 /DNA_ORIENTATION=-